MRIATKMDKERVRVRVLTLKLIFKGVREPRMLGFKVREESEKE